MMNTEEFTGSLAAGQITLSPILRGGFPAGHEWHAEYGGHYATAHTKEEAVACLREGLAKLGRPCADSVYDIQGSIRAWMN